MQSLFDQGGHNEITPWLLWFIGCLDRAFDGADTILGSVLRKAQFWERTASQPMNERQREVIDHLLDGSEGELTNVKWSALTKTSSNTALRSISDLVQRGVLVKDAASGRSTSYPLISDVLA